MGNSAEKAAKKQKKLASKHNCLKSCFKYKFKKFKLRFIPKVWSFTDEHLKMVQQSPFKFPQDVITIILLYLPQNSYILQSDKISIQCVVYIRCTDNKIVDIIQQDGYRSPYLLCQYRPIYPYSLDYKQVIPEFQIGMFGANAVGKSSITKRWTTVRWDDYHSNTIEYEYRKYVQIEGKTFVFNIFDSCPLEFYPLIEKWIKESNMCIVCFSVNDINSFNAIDQLIKQIMEINRKNNGEYSIVICGNKIDLRDKSYANNNLINMDAIISKISKLGLPYIETSAEDNININYLYSYTIYEHWFQTFGNVVDWDNVWNIVCNDF